MQPRNRSLALGFAPLVLGFASIAALSPPAAAQFTEKTVISLMKAEIKDTLKVVKGGLGAALQDLDGGFVAFELAVEDGALTTVEAQAFLDAAVAFQRAVMEAREAAENGLADDIATGLGLLAGDTSLDGVFPAGFYAGDGGLFDDALAAIAKEVDKVYAKAGKRGAKAIKTFAKHGLGLTVQLVSPPRVGFSTPGEDLIDTNLLVPTALGVLVGASDLDAPGDGLVLAAGTSDPGFDDVEVLLTATPAQFSAEATPDGDGVWSVLIDDQGAGLPEGNWQVSLDLDPGVQFGVGSVGVQ
jgi:hypothetical protein